VCRDSTIEVIKRNPECCRIVIGMDAKARITFKGTIKDKFNVTAIIIKNAKGRYLALSQVEILGEALTRCKAEPRSPELLLQGFQGHSLVLGQGYEKMPLPFSVSQKKIFADMALKSDPQAIHFFDRKNCRMLRYAIDHPKRR